MVDEKTFPSQGEKNRISLISKYTKLYELKQRGVLGVNEVIERQYKNKRDLVYIAHAVPSRISEFYGDFVQGDEERLSITSAGDDTKEQEFIDKVLFDNDLIEKIYDMGVEQSEYGYFILHAWVDDSKGVHIDLVPQDQYFPQADGSVIIATYKKVTANLIDSYVCLTQHYSIEAKKVKIERQAWKCEENGKLIESKPLSEVATLFGKTEIKDTDNLDIDEIPFVKVDNGRKERNGFGKSDYHDIFPQLAELNERVTHTTTQLLKNLDAKMQVPKVAGITDEEGNIVKFDYLLMDSKELPDAKFITNENPLLDKNMEQIIFLLKFISWVSAVPMNEVLKSAMPERVEALKMQLFGAIRRTNTKRAKIKRGIKDVLRLSGKMVGLEFDKDPVINMSDVLPEDEQAVAQTEQIKVSAGFSSRRSAMMRLEGYSLEEADAEMKKINEEEAIAGVDLDTPPTL